MGHPVPVELPALGVGAGLVPCRTRRGRSKVRVRQPAPRPYEPALQSGRAGGTKGVLPRSLAMDTQTVTTPGLQVSRLARRSCLAGHRASWFSSVRLRMSHAVPHCGATVASPTLARLPGKPVPRLDGPGWVAALVWALKGSAETSSSPSSIVGSAAESNERLGEWSTIPTGTASPP